MQKFFIRLKVIFSIIASVLVVLYIFAFPIIIPRLKKQNPIDNIYGTHSSPVVLDLWHVETFEGGTTSRKSFLEDCVKSFTRQNSGVYISVTVMTREQYDLNITGSSPDIVSFSDGNIRSSLVDLARIDRVAKYVDNLKYDGDIVCYPYMLGRYAIISREEIGGDLPNEIIKQKKRTIYPFGYSKDVNGHMYLEESGYTLPSNSKVYNTQYELYTAFLKGEVTAMLGSQRDVHRLKSREEKGTIDALHYIYLGGTTDLVQYIGVTKSSKDIDSAKLFCQYLVEKCDEKVKRCGMFSPFECIYEDSYMQEWEKQIKYTRLGNV